MLIMEFFREGHSSCNRGRKIFLSFSYSVRSRLRVARIEAGEVESSYSGSGPRMSGKELGEVLGWESWVDTESLAFFMIC